MKSTGESGKLVEEEARKLKAVDICKRMKFHHHVVGEDVELLLTITSGVLRASGSVCVSVDKGLYGVNDMERLKLIARL